MEQERSGLSLASTISAWPVASNIACHLPAGDLITLSRTSATLRAALHGFPIPVPITEGNTEQNSVRDSIFVGLHQTPEWQSLKDVAPFECSSQTHTKGSTPKPCQFCSKPICEACIVRDSFAHRNENTFRNRTRSFCYTCWDNGNLSKSMRYTLSKEQLEPDTNYCTCTLKKDGWICIPCKEKQNQEAQSSNGQICHGEGCQNGVGEDAESRRMCLWCQRTLPRHLGAASRRAWNQKMIEARYRSALSRMADLEEYNRKLSRSLKMSRRQMRGDDAVQGDPEAGVLQFVRDLDVVNYRSLMPDDCAPSAEEIYESKRGRWRYNKNFLLRAQKGCDGVRWPLQFFNYLNENHPGPFQRSNREKLEELDMQNRCWNIFKLDILKFQMRRTAASGYVEEDDDVHFYNYAQNHHWPLDFEMRKEFLELKYRILTYIVDGQLSLQITRHLIEAQYGFIAARSEWLLMLFTWFKLRPNALPEEDLIRCFDEGRRESQAQKEALDFIRDHQQSTMRDILDPSDKTQQQLDDRKLALELASKEERLWQNYYHWFPYKSRTGLDDAESPLKTVSSWNKDSDDMKWEDRMSLGSQMLPNDKANERKSKGKRKAQTVSNETTQQISATDNTEEPARPDPPSYESVWTGASKDTMLELTTADPMEGRKATNSSALQEDEEMYDFVGDAQPLDSATEDDASTTAAEVDPAEARRSSTQSQESQSSWRSVNSGRSSQSRK